MRALAVAEPEGIRGPFLRLGRTRLAALMARQRWLVPQHSAFVDALVEQLRPDQTGAEPLSSTGRLSERELEVLRYLPTMFNAGEIAEDLHVSVNTVKAHLRAIYRKLGVSRRQDAVGQAQKLRIL